MKIAVVGSGVAGIGAAWVLSQTHEVTVYEKEDYLGGHTNTIDVTLPKNKSTPVDTGFIVFNYWTYPNLLNFFKHLGIKFQNSDMSFAVSVDKGRFEWNGDGLSTLFAQKSNLFSWSFHQMLYDMLRFNREAPAFLLKTDEKSLNMTLGEFLDNGRYSESFRVNYLLPMAASVWSTPAGEMLKFPAMTLLRFYHNHGFLLLTGRPQWLTVVNGSRSYVKPALQKIKQARTSTAVVSIRRTEAGKVIILDSTGREEEFDHVVLACHGDQSLRLLSDPSPEERTVLGKVQYKKNLAVVHRDTALMPKLRKTWASWNYLAQREGVTGHEPEVCLTYWMNRLQPFIPAGEKNNIFVTLNPIYEVKKDKIIKQIEYEHPVYTPQSIAAQQALPSIQGKRNTWFCGAWTNYGFHEDGLTSGLRVAEAIGAKCPFPVADATHVRPLPSKL